MLALDSNVLLRFITEDDSAQTPVATAFLEREVTPEQPGYVSLPTLCEIAWSLHRLYGFSAAQVAEAIRAMLTSAQLRVEREDLVARALLASADFTDALIHELGRQAGCSETVTFDRRFARLPGVRLLRA